MSPRAPGTVRTLAARDRESQADRAYRALRRAIITWAIEPGSRLGETDLQELSGTGRTPTREAAARLAENGLVVAVPRNGYLVVDVDVDSTAALYDVWEALAPMTGRSASGREAASAVAALRRFVAAPGPVNQDELIAFCEHIFWSVLRASSNAWLETVGMRLFDHLLRLWVLAFASEPHTAVVDGFRRMLDALEIDDPEEAAAAYLRFTRYTRVPTLRAVERYLDDRTAFRG